jgi:hypothetical protein
LLHSSRIGCCAKHPWGVPSCVKDARERAFAAARAGWSDPCIFLFFCRFGSSIPGLTISNNTHSLVPAARFCARGFASLLHSPRIEGWAERRETFGCCAKHPWDTPSCVKTRVNALMTRDARLSALHRGGFGLPGPRFRLLRRPPSYNGGQLPCGSVQRAPRTQVVVPGGRGPCLPSKRLRAAAAGRHASLRLQDRLRRRPSMSGEAM